jgi:hypothetical protein
MKLGFSPADSTGTRGGPWGQLCRSAMHAACQVAWSILLASSCEQVSAALQVAGYYKRGIVSRVHKWCSVPNFCDLPCRKHSLLDVYMAFACSRAAMRIAWHIPLGSHTLSA